MRGTLAAHRSGRRATSPRRSAGCKLGDTVGLRGPFGSRWPMEACKGQDVVIACGGIGLAPLRPVIYHIIRHRADYGRVILLYGARTPGDLLYADEYDAWRKAGIEVQVTVDIGDDDLAGPRRRRARRCSTACASSRAETQRADLRPGDHDPLRRSSRPWPGGSRRDHIYVSLERNMNCAIGLLRTLPVRPDVRLQGRAGVHRIDADGTATCIVEDF